MVFAKNVDSCTKVNGFHGKATEPWALCMVATYSEKRSGAFSGVQRRSTERAGATYARSKYFSLFKGCLLSLSSIYTPSGQRPRRIN